MSDHGRVIGRGRVLGLSVILLWGGYAAPCSADSWKCGVAKVDITPKQFMWMSGYGARDRPADGKLTSLWAKALVVEDPRGEKVVLVALDLIGIDRELSLRIRSDLGKRFGFTKSQIALCFSHTHTGPMVGKNLRAMGSLDARQEELIDEYASSLSAHIPAVVGQALKRLQPSTLSWGIGRATFAVNRRENRPESKVPEWREQGKLKGPVDHDVPVLRVVADGKIIATVVGYACHCTVLSFYEWSGDYAGFAQIELEKSNPDAIALFWAGCGGDQNPLPRRKVSLAKEYGRQLARAANDVLGGNMYPIHGTLGFAYSEIDLSFGPLPTREQIGINAQSPNRFEANRAHLLLERMERDGALSPTYPYPIQTWRLGQHLIFVTLGGEVVVDYSLRLKQEIGPGATWIAAYANDVMGYIPSRRVLAEGGYEGGKSSVYYGLPTVWASEVEEDIVDAVRRQVSTLRESAR